MSVTFRARNRRHLFEEARSFAAAVSPELLDEIPITRPGGLERLASGNLVRIMLVHGHRDAAVNYLLHYETTAAPDRATSAVKAYWRVGLALGPRMFLDVMVHLGRPAARSVGEAI